MFSRKIECIKWRKENYSFDYLKNIFIAFITVFYYFFTYVMRIEKKYISLGKLEVNTFINFLKNSFITLIFTGWLYRDHSETVLYWEKHTESFYSFTSYHEKLFTYRMCGFYATTFCDFKCDTTSNWKIKIVVIFL